ncbi:hypothetical protein SDC9_103104 [bioreactor metagenome]|uniref:Uncharacterized protein n=1 Tax=bioreactor metagenome TaxID=1076179 RepID=A0A645ASQ9_9ZZZZ
MAQEMDKLADVLLFAAEEGRRILRIGDVLVLDFDRDLQRIGYARHVRRNLRRFLAVVRTHRIAEDDLLRPRKESLVGHIRFGGHRFRGRRVQIFLFIIQRTAEPLAVLFGQKRFIFFLGRQMVLGHPHQEDHLRRLEARPLDAREDDLIDARRH